MDTQNSTLPLYSRFGDDPMLGELVTLFAEEMPERTAKLADLSQCKQWEEVRRTAHQLKGAAGSYGFDEISPAAARLEDAIRDGLPEECLRDSVEELLSICGRVRAGSSASAAPVA